MWISAGDGVCTNSSDLTACGRNTSQTSHGFLQVQGGVPFFVLDRSIRSHLGYDLFVHTGSNWLRFQVWTINNLGGCHRVRVNHNCRIGRQPSHKGVSNITALKFSGRVPVQHEILGCWFGTQVKLELFAARKAFSWDLIQSIGPIDVQRTTHLIAEANINRITGSCLWSGRSSKFHLSFGRFGVDRFDIGQVRIAVVLIWISNGN
mmetsp:Transcript_38645/g.93419  ORF Transcript_38645/g.93419 Transcript_38645/m.93419 type:complete len:206 (-) Transcript_38645:570-1187(-)